jgi:hypothetical protein
MVTNNDKCVNNKSEKVHRVKYLGGGMMKLFSGLSEQNSLKGVHCLVFYRILLTFLSKFNGVLCYTPLSLSLHPHHPLSINANKSIFANRELNCEISMLIDEGNCFNVNADRHKGTIIVFYRSKSSVVR